MLRREFLQMLGLRPTLAAVNPNPQPESSFVSVQQFGAAGDGQQELRLREHGARRAA